MGTKNRSCLGIIAILLGIAILYTGVRLGLDMSAYKQGHTAMLAADCSLAISHYDEVINSFHLITIGDYKNLSNHEKYECLPFKNATLMQEARNSAGATFAFYVFISEQPASILVKPAQARLSELLKADPASLADENNCRQPKQLTQTAGMDKTTADSVLPGLYAACGAKYLIIYQQQKAYEMFYTLIAEYPDHKLVSSAIASLLANPYTCTIADTLKDDLVLAHQENLVPKIYLACADHFSQTNYAESAYDMYLAIFRDYPLFAQANNISESLQANQYACDVAKRSVLPEYLQNINGLIPDIYYRCGKTYSTAKEYKDAITIFERFLNEYPREPRLEEVRTLLAQAMIADARSTGAGTIDTPQKTGTTSTGKTMVQIQNDSPNRIRLVFTGPVTRIEELDPCASCITYSIIGPTYCPEKGPLGQYELPTGNYDVLVESIGDDITPFTGNWSLGGGNYYSCFFIVTSYK